MPDTEPLIRVALGRGLNPEAAAMLLSVARPVSFMKGARLVRQGEPSRGAYLIGKGDVEAQIALPGGGMLTVARLGDGDVFGEMALIDKGVCSASVVARSNVDGWFIERTDFRALVASRNPGALEVQRAVTDSLVDKLRKLNEQLLSHPAQEDRDASVFPPGGEPLADVPRTRQASFACRGFLPMLPFFESFDEYELDETIAAAKFIELGRGRWLFANGTRANACYLVVRGALEIVTRVGTRERRIAIAGPGELVGYLAALHGAPHSSSARVREPACLMEYPSEAFLALYNGDSGASVSLQQAIHRSLLRSLARTNTQLTRLIGHARLVSEPAEAAELEAALHGQIVLAA